ncbi:MAG: MMPL family transporter [Deltaproteobacteria bacterium]|nr:MMPL family transporter [Deltaproteobacteria bacterium]
MTPEAPVWAKAAVRFRWPLLFIIGVVLTGLFLYGVSIMSVNVVLEDMFPFGHPFVKLHKEFGSQFGGASTTLIEVKATKGDIFNNAFLQKVKGITDAIVFHDDAYSLLTASISERKMKYMRGYSGGRVEMDGIMWPKIPDTEKEFKFMKENLYTNPLYNGVLVSEDGTAALIIGEFKEGIDYKNLFNFFMGLKEKYEDETTSLHMIGKPVLLGWIYSYWPEMMVIFAVSIGIMMALLLLFFRIWQGMVIPILTALVSSVWGLGILGFVGVNLSPLLFVLPFLVGARALGQSVQMAQRYYEELDVLQGNRVDAASRAMGALFIPGFSAVLTDMAGFSVCYLAKILLMQQLAISLTIWMLAIFVLTGIFTPLLCCVFPSPKGKFMKSVHEEHEVTGKHHLVDGINLWLTRLAIGKKGNWGVIATFTILYVFSVIQTTRVPVGDPTAGSPILWPDSVYNGDYAEINRTFKKAGADNYMVFFRGIEEFASKDPKVLKTFERLDRYMRAHMADVYGGDSCLYNVVRKLNKEMHDGNPIWEFVPDEEALCTSMLFLFQSKSVPGDLDRYADPRFYNTNTLMFFKDHTEETIDRIRASMTNFFDTNPKVLDGLGEYLLAGGVIGMETAVNEEIAMTHTKVNAYVLTAVFTMCALAYRSLLAGFILIVPLLLATLLTFVYMSFAQIGMTINTLPVSAVGVGVGVNFGLYIFSRMKEEMKINEGNWTQSLMITARTASKGVVYTALPMILPCMAWYGMSSLKFQAQMGLLLGVLLTFNMLAALILHPAVIYRLKPKFIYKPNK